MTWPTDEAKTKLIDALLTFKELNDEETVINFLEQELVREHVCKERRAATKQQALPAPEPVAGKSPELAKALDALEFYANKDNWSGKNSVAQRDKGARAIKTIAEIEEDE